MTAIYEKEIKSYFIGFAGYVFCALVLLFAGIYTMVINLHNAVASFEYVLSSMAFIFIIVIPILTMRVFAEEKKQKTDMLLYSLPKSMFKIVMGKYLAMITVLAIPLAVISLYPIILNLFGTINLSLSYGSLLAFFLLGASLIAMGMFVSSLSENQAVAAAVCFILVLLNFFISDLADFVSSSAFSSFIALTVAALLVSLLSKFLTKSTAAAVTFALVCIGVLMAVISVSPSSLEGLFPSIISRISVFDRFYTFVDGVFDGGAIIYFLTVIALFIFFTDQSLEKRRWN